MVGLLMFNLYFYPRSPCGERRIFNCFSNPGSTISIHALLAESDYDGLIASANFCNFYPRSPCGERPIPCAHRRSSQDFYPRSPCGERQAAHNITARNNQFLSTLSLRRATVWIPLDDGSLFISIHALLAESDVSLPGLIGVNTDFYPRSPCGERPSGVGRLQVFY